MAKVQITVREVVEYKVTVEIERDTLPDGWLEDTELLDEMECAAAEVETRDFDQMAVEERDVTEAVLVAADSVPNVQAPKHEPEW